MNLSDLDFPYPENLVATERAPMSRVMWAESGAPRELAGGISELVQLIPPGDVLVLNDTKVLRRRVFTESGLEILFLNECLPTGEVINTAEPKCWQVLCPSSRWKNGTSQFLPGGIELQILSRGRPQIVEAAAPLTPEFFEAHGEMPLPPYIQKARGERHNRQEDMLKYQTAWAEKPGSLAAPTASLHFSPAMLQELRARGVHVEFLTLHVGLGTFLPITVDNLNDHIMHAESAEISNATWSRIIAAKKSGAKIWALGTTVTRTLESAALGKLHGSAKPGAVAFSGATDLFIRPGFQYQIVDRLMTNFHQPPIDTSGVGGGILNAGKC